MDTNSKPSHTEAGTVHVDALLAAALNGEAQRTGRTLEAVFREHLGIPTGPLTVKVVDMTAALEEQLRAGLVKPGTPISEVLQAALVAAVRQPTEGQP